MTTYSTNTTMPDISTDAGYQAYIFEWLTILITNLGLTQVNDTGSVTTSNYNASMTCNAQTATSVLTVNSISAGGNNICVGMQVVGAGITAGTYITSFGTGTGGTGTYNLSTTPGTVAAESMTIQFKAPAANTTFQGYMIFRFNDTLQSTSAIYVKLEFGRGGGAQDPGLMGTMGTGSNGSGTITGASTARSALFYSNSTPSVVTNYATYACYNTTQGFLGVMYKLGSSNSSAGWGTLLVFRSVDNTGAPTADTANILVNNPNTTNGTAAGGSMLMIDYNGNGSGAQGISSTVAPNGATGSWTASIWGVIPFNNYSTLRGTAGQLFPCFQYKGNTTTPGLGITNAIALGAGAEFSAGATTTATILGSTSLTYVAGAVSTGYVFITGLNYNVGTTTGTVALLMIYQ
jgi:hypothetical protein